MRVRRPRSRAALGALLALAAVALVTVVGLIDLWPSGRDVSAPGLAGAATEAARVIRVDDTGCRAVATGPSGGLDAPTCRRVTVRIGSGLDAGAVEAFDLSGPIDVSVGDGVRVVDSGLPEGAVVGGVPADRYSLSDFERRAPLAWLAIAFAALVVLTTRRRGLSALLGLGISLGIVVLFVVPAILEGAEPLAVATVGALAIMLTTIPLAHGLGPKAVAACLGTAGALGLTVALSGFAVDLAHISGFSSDEATLLSAADAQLSIRGLLLAGIVIGALGVLDDLTVTQASTVMALRRANPALGARELYRRGLSVGHDHIVATVNTLVLTYAGASLPVLLVFGVADTSFSTAINGEVVASQIVATLVGSIGLIAAVPITTGLAAVLAARLDPDDLGDVHTHAH